MLVEVVGKVEYGFRVSSDPSPWLAALQCFREAYPWAASDEAIDFVRERWGAGLSAARVEDVLLAFGCATGEEGALRAFEGQVLPAVARRLRRVDSRSELVSEIMQRVRVALLVPPETGVLPKIALYRGVGPLRAWVTTAALRLGLAYKIDGSRFVMEVSTESPPSSAIHRELPAVDVLAFREEFRRAVAELDAESCALLLAHYVDGVPLDELAERMSVSRVTLWRRLSAARDRLRVHIGRTHPADDLAALADVSSIRRLLIAGKNAPPEQ